MKAAGLLWLCLFLCASACAQTSVPAKKSAPATPTVEQIFDHYVAALGGRSVLKKLTSRVTKGTVQVEGLATILRVEISQKMPNKLLMKIRSAGRDLSIQAFDGRRGWSRDPETGLREMYGEELTNAKLEADFYQELNLREEYPQAKLLGRAKVAAREAYVIEATPIDASPRKLYFDKRNGLLLRMDFIKVVAGIREPVQAYLEDYRSLDGTQFAFRWRYIMPQSTATIRYTQVQHNVPIDDAIFREPSAP